MLTSPPNSGDAMRSTTTPIIMTLCIWDFGKSSKLPKVPYPGTRELDRYIVDSSSGVLTPASESKNAKKNAKRSSARKKAKAALREASGLEAGSSPSGISGAPEQSTDGVNVEASTLLSTQIYS